MADITRYDPKPVSLFEAPQLAEKVSNSVDDVDLDDFGDEADP